MLIKYGANVKQMRNPARFRNSAELINPENNPSIQKICYDMDTRRWMAAVKSHPNISRIARLLTDLWDNSNFKLVEFDQFKK